MPARLNMYNTGSNRFTPSISINSRTRRVSRNAGSDERVRSSRGDMRSASNGLRNAQEIRNAEVSTQRGKTRNGRGQFLNAKEKSRNARNARQKQAYDIKRAFGVSVG